MSTLARSCFGESSTTWLASALQRAVLAAALFSAAPAFAADDEIVLAQTAGFTGPVADSVKESTSGARLYFDWVNSTGGVNGRKIVLDSRDDKWDPKTAGEIARKLIEERRPIAFFVTRGTPHTEAVLPHLQAANIPIISPGSGAEIFHEPVNPLVFNVRAKYSVEIEKAIEHLYSTGLDRIALVHVRDSFGADGLAGFNRKMGALKLKPLLVTSFDRTTTDVSDAAKAIVAADPQVTFGVGSSTHISALFNQVRKAGSSTQFVTLSNNSTKGFVKALGANARGVMVVQVYPNPISAAPVAREMARLAKDRKDFVASQQAMEGFLAAKVTVLALKRAGKNPTSKSLIAALEGMKDVDLGGFEISFSRANHSGAQFAEMSMIDARGEFLQ